MVIKRGEDWGQRILRPDDLLVFDNDVQANVYLTKQFRYSLPVQSIAILKSNVARSLGLNGSDTNGEKMLKTSFDVLEVEICGGDGKVSSECFLGNAVIRNSWRRGTIIGVFNTAFIAGRDWAPRAHPNDGKLDVLLLDEAMGLRQRLTAYRLSRSGSHLPHPHFKYLQNQSYVASDLEGAKLTVDSVEFGKVESCSFRVIPDAVSIYW